MSGRARGDAARSRRFSLTAEVAPERFGGAATGGADVALAVAAELVARLLAEQRPRLGLAPGRTLRLGVPRLHWAEDPNGRFDRAVTYLKLRRAGRPCFVVLTALYRGGVLVATVRQRGAPRRASRERRSG